MKLLAIETATEACSVAVLVDGSRYKVSLPQTGTGVEQDSVGAMLCIANGIEHRLFFFHEVAPRRHGELLLPAVDRLLAEAGVTLGELDAIAFGRGPGAFTGVRIAVSAAQGLGFGSGKPLVPVSTLAALAQGALDAGARQVAAAIDARMGEVYAGLFEADAEGLAVAIGDEWLGPVDGFRVPDGYRKAGTGFGLDDLPTAAAVARIAVREFTAGRTVTPEMASPVYLRDTVTNL